MGSFFRKGWVKFILLMCIFTAITAPIVVLFGPFDNIKRTVVGAILRSRHPQYITWLYTPEEIQKIVGTVGTGESQELFKFDVKEDTSLNLRKIESKRYTGFILEIPDPRRIQVATAPQLNEKGETTSNIARLNGAIAAINGGGFHDPNGTGTGRSPYGFILHDGEYVIGKDVGPDEDVDFIGFTKAGNLIAGTYNKRELKEMGAKEGLTFGPPLIVNGKKMITDGDGGWGIGPRTAIAQKKDGTVLFLVIDGRQAYSAGATLRDVQDILYQEGAVIAANLDGGSSTTLYYNGKTVNKPADLLGERMIPTVFIVK